MSVLFNIGLYLLIAEKDIQAVKIEALTHPDEWTRKIYARIILLVIYEWVADAVSRRTLKEALDTMLISDDLKREAIEVLRTLRSIQRKVRTNFAFVRNAAIAHRDSDALTQYPAIRELKVDEVMAVAIEFYAAVAQFTSLLTKLMMAGSTIGSFLMQWSKNHDRQQR